MCIDCRFPSCCVIFTCYTSPSSLSAQLDFEWYLSNQILPPISRLCEPIEGTSAAIMSGRLGLDVSK